MARKTVEFCEDYGSHATNGNKNALRDVDSKETILCAFDNHGKCRKTCAALVVEGSPAEIKCLRMPRENIIGYLKEDS